MSDRARPRVTGGSILVGNFSFSSPDGSVEFDGGPAQGQIKASVPGLVVPTDGVKGVIVKSFESAVLDASEVDSTVQLLPSLPGWLASYISIQPAFALGSGGTITVGAKWKIGQNDPDFDDWLPASDGPAIVGVDPVISALSQDATLITKAGFRMSDLNLPPFAVITQACDAAAFMRIITTVALVAGDDF